MLRSKKRLPKLESDHLDDQEVAWRDGRLFFSRLFARVCWNCRWASAGGRHCAVNETGNSSERFIVPENSRHHNLYHVEFDCPLSTRLRRLLAGWGWCDDRWLSVVVEDPNFSTFKVNLRTYRLTDDNPLRFSINTQYNFIGERPSPFHCSVLFCEAR